MEARLNIFIITFATHEDKQGIWDGRPWIFDNHHFVVKQFKGTLHLHQIKLKYENFWIQMHELPLDLMHQKDGEQIEKTIGRVVDVDLRPDGCG